MDINVRVFWLPGLVATRSGGETDIFDVLSGPLELDVGLLSACGDVKNWKNELLWKTH